MYNKFSISITLSLTHYFFSHYNISNIKWRNSKMKFRFRNVSVLSLAYSTYKKPVRDIRLEYAIHFHVSISWRILCGGPESTAFRIIHAYLLFFCSRLCFLPYALRKRNNKYTYVYFSNNWMLVNIRLSLTSIVHFLMQFFFKCLSICLEHYSFTDFVRMCFLMFPSSECISQR